MHFLDTIHSRDNALIKQLHKLAGEGAAYRKLGQVWLEGEHLVSSFLQHFLQQWALPNTIKTEATQAGLAALNA